MRKRFNIILILLALLLANCSNNSGNSREGLPAASGDDQPAEIAFREYEHNFGRVVEGEKVAYIFSFENKGAGPLVIKSASTSCGCTVPKYDTKPIPSGAGGSMEVVFDTSGRSGMQTKTISVHSNSKTPVVILKITAEIITANNNN